MTPKPPLKNVGASARAKDEYSGVRITMTAEIAGARLAHSDRHRIWRCRYPEMSLRA